MKKYSIKANLRIDKMNLETGECPVRFVIRVNGKSFKFGQLSLRVLADVWNSKTGLVEIKKLKKTDKDYPRLKAQYEELNKAILHWTAEFHQFMLEQDRLGVNVTPDKIKDFFDVGKRISFYDYWDKQIELMRPSKRPSTMISYEHTKQILKEFRPNLEFGDITPEFITKFDNYLTTKRGNSDGGKFNRHKNLKAILNLAIRDKYITDYPYKYFKVKEAKGNRMRLTLSELKAVRNLSLSNKSKSLEQNRKMFLFSCYTGLRFSDIQLLTWKHISFEEAELEMKMLKTSNAICIPLIPDALQILRELKHQNTDEIYVFKRITNQAINRALKDIMKEAEIDKEITFHCARHTFATVNLQVGTSIVQLKDMMGHRNISETQIYARTLQMSVNASMEHFGRQVENPNDNPIQVPISNPVQPKQINYGTFEFATTNLN